MSIKFAYYRIFQFIFNLGARILPWRKATPVTGVDAIREIPHLLSGLNGKKPIVVTGPVLMQSGIPGRIIEILKNSQIQFEIYDNVGPNPKTNIVNSIQQLYIEKNCDSFIAIGGGSAMDAAKAAAARVVQPDKSIKELGGLLKVKKKIPPFIAVATTSGSGSETTIAAVVTDNETHHKYAILDLKLIPDYAILDPILTAELPPFITATTGMDALTHAVEAYLCWTYNTEESKAYALEAVRLIFHNIEKVYQNGHDLDARLNMMIASYKAGFAFTRAGVGNIHAIAHTLGGLYNTSHGLANAIIMPVVLEDYGEKVYKKLAILAEAAGFEKRDGSVKKDSHMAKQFIKGIRNLNKKMDIPDHFDCIKEEDIPQMVEWALREANPVYPVPVLYDRKRMSDVIRSLSYP